LFVACLDTTSRALAGLPLLFWRRGAGRGGTHYANSLDQGHCSRVRKLSREVSNSRKYPSTNLPCQASAFAVWILELGICLDVGCWDLEFPAL
jgi:hypothetical protein